MTVCGADFRPADCVRDLVVLIDRYMTLSNHVKTWQEEEERGWHLLLSATHVTYHKTFLDDRCCTLAGSGSDPHPSRLLQRSPGRRSKVPAREVAIRPPCRRQTRSATPTSCVCFSNHARTVALARDARSCSIQTVYPCIQMPARTRSSLLV